MDSKKVVHPPGGTGNPDRGNIMIKTQTGINKTVAENTIGATITFEGLSRFLENGVLVEFATLTVGDMWASSDLPAHKLMGYAFKNYHSDDSSIDLLSIEDGDSRLDAAGV
jgi:hypothetical protein